MSAFAQWLSGMLNTVVEWFYNALIDLLQSFSDVLIDFILVVVSLFPQVNLMTAGQPSSPSGEAMSIFLQTLNWIFPVSYLLDLVAFGSAAMLAYFFIAPLARWFKLLT